MIVQASKSLSLLLLAIACLLVLPIHATAQPWNEAAADTSRSPFQLPDPDTKIGLVLSGGAAKGLAHIGVLKVLEEVGMPIDYITGTSMGALIGGLYSIGYSASDLEELALSIDWTALFSDEISRKLIPMEEKEWEGMFLLSLPILDKSIKLPTGLVAGQRVSKLLSELTWEYPGRQDFTKFPIPFTCMATDIETGDAVVLSEGYLSEAIRASIAIPSIFIPKRIDGRLLVDGGVVRNLPVEEALGLGAGYVISVNVSSPLREGKRLNSIIEFLDQTMSFQIVRSVEQSKELSGIIIEPAEAINYTIADFDKAVDIIALGEKEARKQYDKLKQLADFLNSSRSEPTDREAETEDRSTVYIREIRVKGTEHSSAAQIKNKLQVQENSHATMQQISNGIENVYGLLFFESVTYRLVDKVGGFDLEVEVVEKPLDQFRFGFYYDNISKAAILLNANFRNLLTPGSVVRFNLKLGDEPFANLIYFNYLTLNTDIALSMRINYSQQKIDIFNRSGQRIVQYNTNSLYFQTHFLPITTNRVQAGVGVQQEFFNIARSVGEFQFPSGFSSITKFQGIFRYDNRDRLYFTRNGQYVELDGGLSVNFFDNSQNFSQAEFNWRGFFELGERWVFLMGLRGGLASRSELPLHKQFYQGGFPDFVGYRRYEIGSHNIRMAQAGLQFEFIRNNFLGVRANAASDAEFTNFNPFDQRVFFGYGVTYGLNTLIGPVKVSASSSTRNSFLLEYSLGVRF